MLFGEKGVGIDRIKLVTCSASDISRLNNTQIQNITDYVNDRVHKTVTISNDQSHVSSKMITSDHLTSITPQASIPSASSRTLIPEISEKILPEVNASTTPMPAEDVSVKHLNGNSLDGSSKIGPVAVSTPSVPQINVSNQSRLPISILPEDPEEKRKHIIGLVLEKFPYLSLDDSDERRDTFNLDSSALCPLCNGDHKVNRSIFDEIKGEWGDGEYYGEQTYRLICRISYKPGIPVVSVKA
ncbi:hypothetical protein C1646_676841 [Rhizophagus diaphanus]|nr:hypothetical protein C1646_676841 [Rhizophagus diaphanus] [Rhizophagus sp. MUCL 43196]